KDRLFLEASSVFVETLKEPDFRTIAEVELPDTGVVQRRAALHPDGEMLAIATHQRPVRWVCDQPLKMDRSWDRPGPQPSLRFSPDGRYLVFARGDGGLELWDGEMKGLLR